MEGNGEFAVTYVGKHDEDVETSAGAGTWIDMFSDDESSARFPRGNLNVSKAVVPPKGRFRNAMYRVGFDFYGEDPGGARRTTDVESELPTVAEMTGVADRKEVTFYDRNSDESVALANVAGIPEEVLGTVGEVSFATISIQYAEDLYVERDRDGSNRSKCVTVRWRVDRNRELSRPAVGGGVVSVGTAQGVQGFDSRTGEELWHSEDPEPILSGPLRPVNGERLRPLGSLAKPDDGAACLTAEAKAVGTYVSTPTSAGSATPPLLLSRERSGGTSLFSVGIISAPAVDSLRESG